MPRVATAFLCAILTLTTKLSSAQCGPGTVSSAQELVNNGNFSQGNTGFITPLNYVSFPQTLDNASDYTITTSGTLTHWAFEGYDHTTGNGNFMAINGASNAIAIWSQTVTVTPYTYYRFSAWFNNLVKPSVAPGQLAYVELHINGNKVSDKISINQFPDIWISIDTLWYSDYNTSVVLSIFNSSTAGHGNDFAVDDISFKRCPCSGFKRRLPDEIICAGDSLQLNMPETGNYKWQSKGYISDTNTRNPIVKPSVTDTFVATIEDNGCIKTDTVVVRVIPYPMIHAGADRTICKGDTIRLTASGGQNYYWKPNLFIEDSTLSNPNIYPGSNQQYILTGKIGSCYSTDTVNVFVNGLPDVYAGNDTTICKNDTITLNGNSPTAAEFIWLPSTYLNDSTLRNPIAKPDTTIVYYLKGIDTTSGCRSFDTITIKVSNVLAKFSASPQTGSVPLKVDFKNQSSPEPLLYHWQFGDTTESTEKDPVHIYKNINKNGVYLIVKDANGCTDTSDLLEIVVSGEMKFFIPNVFTPNADEVNEFFEVVGDLHLMKQLNGSIWNRWGGRVYDFTMPGGKWWDGNYLGEPSPEGVYFYIINITRLDGETITRHGTVTLLR